MKYIVTYHLEFAEYDTSVLTDRDPGPFQVITKIKAKEGKEMDEEDYDSCDSFKEAPQPPRTKRRKDEANESRNNKGR